MSQRPSVISSEPSMGNGQIVQSPSRQVSSSQPATKWPVNHRSTSLPKLPNDNSNLDPDELFTKYTISEVKFVQQQLRADADAKQEELRLMVGERYRDLLQASTSIISIARSSKRVRDALEEAKGAILAQEAPPLPRRPSLHGNNDTHLQTLQLLSAHMKLLLDAPEHLWRLIERKKYFPAAWLFLLARVVHRALVRDDEQDEETWSSQGLDVLEQFPLVQRQWDAVSQFRSQIIHKATVSLREYTTSSEDTCATLLTLHLLDSRPLTETLFVLLSQRSKTLHTMLSWTLEKSVPSGSIVDQPNGHVPEMTKSMKAQTGFRGAPVREVKQATKTALEAISRTVKTARDIFQDSSKHSLIVSVLEYIQSDSPDSRSSSTALPSELQLTTQTLIMTLPSSTHFLLLPPALRSYKPYVDLTSTSSSVPRAQFTQKLDEWFRKSTKSLQIAMERWFSGLQSVKEVWNIRSSIRNWIDTSSGLEGPEVLHLKSLFDDIYRQRVIEIWKLALVDAEKAFQSRLDTAVSSLIEGTDTRHTDTSPVEYLFRAPPLPILSQAGVGPVDSSLQKYTASLRRQLVGRTALLDEVLTTLENCARALQQDLALVMTGQSENSQELIGQLSKIYQPHAEALCSDVISTLELAAEKDADGSESTMRSLVFIGQIADELASPSSFLSGICCGESTVHEFQKKTGALCDRINGRWRKHTVSRILQEHHSAFQSTPQTCSSSPSAPSSALILSLLSLSSSIQQLGLSREITRQDDIADKTLHLFITNFLDNTYVFDGLQTLYDLAFLRKLVDTRRSEWTDIVKLLDEKTMQVQAKIQPESAIDQTDLERTIPDYLARTQILFAACLPHLSMPTTRPTTDNTDKFATLLPFGAPTLDQQYHSAMELAKPSARFGLLLVGGAAGQ